MPAQQRDLREVAGHVGEATLAVRGGPHGSDVLLSRELLKIGNRECDASPIGNLVVSQFEI